MKEFLDDSASCISCSTVMLIPSNPIICMEAKKDTKTAEYKTENYS